MVQDEARRIWDAVLGELQLQVTRHNFETYLKGTVGLELAQERLTVGVPNDYAIAWLQDRAYPLIMGVVGKVIGRRVEVSFRLYRPQPRFSDVSNIFRANPSPNTPTLRIDPRLTFERFAVGPHCLMAHRAALLVAQQDSMAPNPLYIFGPPGTGKTHLLHAIAHRLHSQGKRAFYITANQFTSDFVTALGQRRLDEFRNRYRDVAAILLDDLHLLAGKDRTQDELYQIVDEVLLEGSSLVVAADRPPHALVKFGPQLVSRLEGGLVVETTHPDLQTRMAILHLKAREAGVQMPDDVAQYIAEVSHRGVREMIGYLNRVVAYARLVDRPLTREAATEALSALLPGLPVTSPSPEAVLRTVAQFFNIPLQAITAKARSKMVADARHIAMYLLREECQLSLKDIGRLLGGRDHSTVIHAINKIEALMRSDPLLRRQVAEMRALLAPSYQAQATA